MSSSWPRSIVLGLGPIPNRNTMNPVREPVVREPLREDVTHPCSPPFIDITRVFPMVDSYPYNVPYE